MQRHARIAFLGLVLLGCAAQATTRETSAATVASGAPSMQTSAAPSAEAAAAVQAHAQVRAAVGVPALEWSAELANVASDWARTLCQNTRGGRATLRHRPQNRYGENIYWMGGATTPPGVDAAVRGWADERQFYDVRRNACSGGECGHYTQLVWRNSRAVGCGSATCGTHTFWVCNYDPPGNFIGQRPY